MALEGVDGLEAGHIPNADRLVRAGGGEGAAVRPEYQRTDPAPMALPDGHFFAGRTSHKRMADSTKPAPVASNRPSGEKARQRRFSSAARVPQSTLPVLVSTNHNWPPLGPARGQAQIGENRTGKSESPFAGNTGDRSAYLPLPRSTSATHRCRWPSPTPARPRRNPCPGNRRRGGGSRWFDSGRCHGSGPARPGAESRGIGQVEGDGRADRGEEGSAVAAKADAGGQVAISGGLSGPRWRRWPSNLGNGERRAIGREGEGGDLVGHLAKSKRASLRDSAQR
jgi:hypothetical protein